MKPDFKEAAINWHVKRYIQMMPSPYPFDRYNTHKAGFEDFRAGADHGYSVAMEQQREIAIAFGIWLNSHAWMHDYTEEKTHTVSEQFDYFISNIFTEREQPKDH